MHRRLGLQIKSRGWRNPWMWCMGWRADTYRQPMPVCKNPSDSNVLSSSASPQASGNIFILLRSLFSTPSFQLFSVRLPPRCWCGESPAYQSSSWGLCYPTPICSPWIIRRPPVLSQDTWFHISESGQSSGQEITNCSWGTDAAISDAVTCIMHRRHWINPCQPPLIWKPFNWYGSPRRGYG